MERHSRIHGWEDAAEIVVLAWLFLSPFILGFFGTMEASLTAVAVAAVSSMFTQFGVATENPWDEWANVLLALILIVSPWLFGYSSLVAATWNAVITGLLLGVFAVLALRHDYADMREARQRTAGQH